MEIGSNVFFLDDTVLSYKVGVILTIDDSENCVEIFNEESGEELTIKQAFVEDCVYVSSLSSKITFEIVESLIENAKKMWEKKNRTSYREACEMFALATLHLRQLFNDIEEEHTITPSPATDDDIIAIGSNVRVFLPEISVWKRGVVSITNEDDLSGKIISVDVLYDNAKLNNLEEEDDIPMSRIEVLPTYNEYENRVRDLICKTQLNSARCAVKLGAMVAACQLCDEVIRIDVESVAAYYLKGRICLSKRKLIEAKENFLTARSIDPRNTQVRTALKHLKRSLEVQQRKDKKLVREMMGYLNDINQSNGGDLF